MPITKSAIKKSRQDIKARNRNRVVRDDFRTVSKKVVKLAQAGKNKEAQEALKEAYSKLDKAAKKNVIHKNNASRRKAKLASLFKKETTKEKK